MAVTGGAIAGWATSAAGAATIASAAVSAYGISQQASASRDARREARSAAELQKMSNKEKEAQAASQQAEARRAQVREERVRRARIMQSGENTGTAESSGAMGAIGGLATNLSSNLGQQAGAALSGQKQTSLLQGAADFGLQSQESQGRSQLYGQVGSTAFNIFQRSIGY